MSPPTSPRAPARPAAAATSPQTPSQASSTIALSHAASTSYFPSSSSGSSYVYPVRSLLSNIQPAADVDTSAMDAGYRSGGSLRGRGGDASDSDGPAGLPGSMAAGGRRKSTGKRAQTVQQQPQVSFAVRTGASTSTVPIPAGPTSFAYPRHPPSDFNININSNPYDASSSSSSSYFGQQPPVLSVRQLAASLPSPPVSDQERSGAQGEDVDITPVKEDITPSQEDVTPGRGGQEPLVAATAFALGRQVQARSSIGLGLGMGQSMDDALSTLFVDSGPTTATTSAPPSRPDSTSRPESADAAYDSDVSSRKPRSLVESGLVHLPPSEPSIAGSRSNQGSRNPAVRSREGQRGSRDGSRQGQVISRSSANTDTDASALTVDSNQPLMTVRFDYKTTETGHHVIVGRDNRLEKCEDEPIRVPGAVQGFGVLVAVAEDEQTGNLVVRQVSENALELLGFSPEYLFSLTCFTQTLPPSQADILWDNVQYLYELDSDAEGSSSAAGGGGQDSPQVFLISGWGQPGSAFPEVAEQQMNPDPHQRREWTAWCAAHRPAAPRRSGRASSDTTGSTALGPSLLVLEFELERDGFNPLYPPFRPAAADADVYMDSASSGGGSPSVRGSGSASASASRSGSNTSGSNTASQASGSGSGSGSRGGGSSSGAESGGSNSTTDSGITQRGEPGEDVMRDPTHSPSAEAAVAGADDYPPGGATQLRTGAEHLPEEWRPSPEDVLESTTNRAKPLKALERMRRVNRQVVARATGAAGALSTVGAPALLAGSGTGEGVVSGSRAGSSAVHGQGQRGGGGGGPPGAGVSTMDVFALLSQVDDQWGRAPNLESFLKIVVGIIKDLTQFHRVLIYQFDEHWNGQVVAELVDWNQTHDLYKGLHFPAADIPPQARQLYAINKVRLLYDRSQLTARLVVRSKADLEPPLDMTHSYLRAMSPIHIKYLENMGVRASMSISIMAFGQLWGLIACHSYGQHGMRVSFPVRQMLRLMSDSISRNIERLSYAARLHTRKLISTLPTDQHPTGYIVSNAEDLLSLFDADFGILVIGEGAKILGPNHSGQEVLIVAEYLRLKQFSIMQVSQAVTRDFPDLNLPSGLDVVAGLLYIPLSSGGRDFIAFLRKGQLKEVHWAGKPFKEEGDGTLEPRTSFKTWSETVTGRCRTWTDEQLETAAVLALVYGKFIEVWRQKESAVKTTQLTNLLLSNASHEVRTPLNHIINYLELALNGPLDNETRENLKLTHTASKSLLFTINDLLDLTRLESGNETSFNEPFDLPLTIQEAVHLYRIEAERRKLQFIIDTNDSPKVVVGDARKIRTVVANLTANAVKYTAQGTITVECRTFQEPVGLRDRRQVAVEIVVGDTGCGIESSKLEKIFREFEQVESSTTRPGERDGLGLGLAVVARIVEQLGGQLRVDSKVGHGSRFSFLIPFALPSSGGSARSGSAASDLNSRSVSPSSSLPSSKGSKGSTIDSLVEALQSDPLSGRSSSKRSLSNDKLPSMSPIMNRTSGTESPGQPRYFDVEGSRFPVRSVKIDEYDLDKTVKEPKAVELPASPVAGSSGPKPSTQRSHAKSLSEAKQAIMTQPEAASIKSIQVQRAGKASPTAGPVKLRILIVEDDPINRTILHKRLVTDGHTVLTTTNGQEAVEKVQSDRDFDCVLMDIQMPILNGFEASEKIREYEDRNPRAEGTSRPSVILNGRIPIFAVSASLVETARDTLFQRGMDGWILKPIDFKRLGRLLRGISDDAQRESDVYRPGHWEQGGWLQPPIGRRLHGPLSPGENKTRSSHQQ